MNFDEKLSMYAKLLMRHGLNVQPGQVVNLTGELANRQVLEKMVQEAYRAGAKFVNVDFIDPIITKTRILESMKEEYLGYVPKYIPIKYEDFIGEAAVLRLTGSEDPDILADLPSDKVNYLQTQYRMSLKKYYAEGVGKSRVQWTVAGAATPKWGKKVFPELSENQAYEALWDLIFKVCRADRPDCLEFWKTHNAKLRERAASLTKMKLNELHFTGPGTDLKVYLTPKAIFTGGGSVTPKGVDFEANIPTEECFTTPDYRLTEGKVRVTRPVMVNGKAVQGLTLEFKKGEIVNFTAEKGRDQFAAYIGNDPGAKRLGEVALVGIDSPIYQCGRNFEEILYDENAACHIAVGSAYRFCLDGGSEMSSEQLKDIGCNESCVHADFMISSDQVDVNATTHSGKKTALIKKGQWLI